MPDKVKTLSRECVYAGYHQIYTLQLQHKQFAGGFGAPITREAILRNDAVAVLPYDPVRDEIVLIEQFRIAPHVVGNHSWLVEAVAGCIGPGEMPEEVARRECQEEMGRPVDRLEWIGRYFVSPGYTTERITSYCGRVNAEGVEGNFGCEDEGEDIRVFSVAADEALAWLERGEISNSLTLIAMQWFALKREWLRERWLA